MSVSRRSALVCVSALAASTANSSIASTMRGVQAALASGGNSTPDTHQRIQHLLVHRDAAPGAPHFAAISIPSGDTAWMSLQNLDERAYHEASAKFALRGYGLRRVNAFQTKGGMRYAAIWQLAQGPARESRHDMTPEQFRELGDRFAADGYRLTHVDGCATNAGTRFAAIWEKRTAPKQEVFAALTNAELKRNFAELTAQGYRPRRIAGYGPHGRTLFAAVFEPDNAGDWRVHHAMTVSGLRTQSNAMFAQGYRLSDASGYVVRGRPMFSGIWDKT
jgi:Bacterial tandem repeat domain 1